MFSAFSNFNQANALSIYTASRAAGKGSETGVGAEAGAKEQSLSQSTSGF